MRFFSDNFTAGSSFLLRRSPVLTVLLLGLLLQSCATSRFIAGGQKNSLPIADGTRLEEVHSIAVAPFYRDDYHWRELVQEALRSTKVAVVPAGRVDTSVRASKKDLTELAPDLRPETLARIGRSVQADAVVNGLVLPKGDRYELVLQLVSSKDSRLLFWQAAEFSFRDSRSDPDAQRRLIAGMLAPLTSRVAARQRPAPPAPAAHIAETPSENAKQEAGEPQKKESPVKEEKRQKQDKRRERMPAPAVVPEEISPM